MRVLLALLVLVYLYRATVQVAAPFYFYMGIYFVLSGTAPFILFPNLTSNFAFYLFTRAGSIRGPTGSSYST